MEEYKNHIYKTLIDILKQERIEKLKNINCALFGGFIRDLLNSEFNQVPFQYNDIDFLVENQDDAQLIKNIFNGENIGIISLDRVLAYSSDTIKSETSNINIQIIVVKNIKEHIRTVDINICSIGYLLNEDNIVEFNGAIESIKNKTFDINLKTKQLNPILFHKRYFKMIRKGFKHNTEEYFDPYNPLSKI
jgi:hypothetical protein